MQSSDGQNISPRDHKLILLVLRYNGAYKKVFGTPFWSGRKYLKGEPNERLDKEFKGILKFFEEQRITVDEHLWPWQGYLVFALEAFKAKGIMPRPSSIKSPGLFKAYCLDRRPVDEPEGERIDYSKVLDPALRSPAALKLLGLDDESVKRELR